MGGGKGAGDLLLTHSIYYLPPGLLGMGGGGETEVLDIESFHHPHLF